MVDFQLTVRGSLVLRAFLLMGDKGCWALLKLAALFGRGFDDVAGLQSTMTYIPCYPATKSGRESSSESAIDDGFAGSSWLRERDEVREGWAQGLGDFQRILRLW